LDKFKNKGWKIDLEKLKSNSLNNKAYSIPGPGRQQSKNYPIDSVPLVKKSQAERPVLRITKN
jgi:hypothetical protein